MGCDMQGTIIFVCIDNRVKHINNVYDKRLCVVWSMFGFYFDYEILNIHRIMQNQS